MTSSTTMVSSVWAAPDNHVGGSISGPSSMRSSVVGLMTQTIDKEDPPLGSDSSYIQVNGTPTGQRSSKG